MQSTYNVTLRRVHETAVAVKTYQYYICTNICVFARVRAYSVAYPACNA
jgi:hypothetical protein